MQDDLNDAVTALSQLGIADASRACVLGWSYGGYAASRAAQPITAPGSRSTQGSVP